MDCSTTGSFAHETAKPLTKGDKAMSNVLQGLEVDLDELFIDVVEEPQALYPLNVQRV